MAGITAMFRLFVASTRATPVRDSRWTFVCDQFWMAKVASKCRRQSPDRRIVPIRIDHNNPSSSSSLLCRCTLSPQIPVITYSIDAERTLVVVADKNAQPVYLSTVSCRHDMGNAVYQSIVLPVGEPTKKVGSWVLIAQSHEANYVSWFPCHGRAAGSSPVVPVIHCKRVVPISVKRGTKKDTVSCPFLCPFQPSSLLRFITLRKQMMAIAKVSQLHARKPIAARLLGLHVWPALSPSSNLAACEVPLAAFSSTLGTLLEVSDRSGNHRFR